MSIQDEESHRKVAEMKAKVEAGTADLNFKFDIAANRLAERVLRELDDERTDE